MEKIKVVLRMRPFNKDEKSRKCKKAWKIDYDKNIITSNEVQNFNTTFQYNKIFSPKSSNTKVYKQSAQDIVSRALDGIDTTLFVYGQTGAGKTHTILGDKEEKDFNGMIFQGVRDLIKEGKRDKEMKLSMKCSCIEIYNELVFDLLKEPDEVEKSLPIYEDKENSKFFVKNRILKKVSSVEDVIRVLEFTEKSRKYAETFFNHKSSRSHIIFSIFIENAKIIKKETAFIKESVLNFVDLAGNERLLYEYKNRANKKTERSPSRSKSKNKSFKKSSTIMETDFYTREEQNKRTTESKNINKSLFFLTQVIQAVSQNRNAKFIPFRNSALTKILRSSFGGNSRTLLIICAAPALIDFDITLSTLRFGKCAKMIENKIKMNIKSDFTQKAFDAIVCSYEEKIGKFYKQLRKLEKQQKNQLKLGKDLKRFKGLLADRYLKFHQNTKTKMDIFKDLENEDDFNNFGGNKKGENSKRDKKNKRNKNKKRSKTKNKSSLNDTFSKYKADNNFHYKNVGIIFSKNSKILKNQNPDCHICKQRFNYSLIPSNPKTSKKSSTPKQDENSKKLWQNVKDTEKLIITHLKNTNNSTNFLTESLNNISNHYKKLIKELLNKLQNTRSNLALYTEEEKIKNLEEKELIEMEKEVRNLWEIYNEEKLRRKFIREYDVKSGKADCVEIDYVFEEKKSYLEIKKMVKKDIMGFNEDFKKIKDDQVSKIDLIKNLKKGVDGFIKSGERSKVQMVERFEEYKKKFEMEKILNEKKLNFIHLKENKKKFKELKRGKSFNNIFDKNFVKDKWFFENKEMIFYYNMINRKFKRMENFNKEVMNLKNEKKGNITNQVIEQILKEKNKNKNADDDENNEKKLLLEKLTKSNNKRNDSIERKRNKKKKIKDNKISSEKPEIKIEVVQRKEKKEKVDEKTKDKFQGNFENEEEEENSLDEIEKEVEKSKKKKTVKFQNSSEESIL